MDIAYFLMISVITGGSILMLLNAILKKITPEKSATTFWSFFIFIIVSCIITFIVSLQVGGWTGIGYGLLSFSVLLGAFLTSVILMFIHVFSNDTS